MKISANKGNWSKFYVLVRLLADGKIYSADENLAQIENRCFSILRIFRSENHSDKIVYQKNVQNDIEVYLNDALIRRIKVSDLKTAAENLFDAIIKGTGTFEIDGAEKIMENLCCTKINSDSNKKFDINMEIYDSLIKYRRIGNYKIKSEFKKSPIFF